MCQNRVLLDTVLQGAKRGSYVQKKLSTEEGLMFFVFWRRG